MLKVAAVIPPASINLGNDFFSLGGIEAFKQTFSNIEMQIHLIEFFDSGERGFNDGRTSFFTEATLTWIKESADLVVLFGGCCLRPDMKPLFQPLIDTGTPFIGWGLSPTDYNQADVQFAKEIADQSLALITRDDIIAKMVGEYPKFMSGMDGGWWMGSSYNRPEKTSEYLVINIESGNKLNVNEAQKALEILQEQTKSPIYMVSNNCERDYHHMHPQSLLITNSRHLYTTLANASYVVTSRAHSTICCLTNGVPVEYVGSTEPRVMGLMKTVGYDFKNEGSLEPEEIMKKVEESKNNFMEKVRANVTLP